MRRRTAHGGGAAGTAHGLPISISDAKCRANKEAVVRPEFATSGEAKHGALWKSELDAKLGTYNKAKSSSKLRTKREPN